MNQYYAWVPLSRRAYATIKVALLNSKAIRNPYLSSGGLQNRWQSALFLGISAGSTLSSPQYFKSKPKEIDGGLLASESLWFSFAEAVGSLILLVVEFEEFNAFTVLFWSFLQYFRT